jgi:PAS domain S-box-containing protein
VLETNPAFQELVGYGADELRSMRFTDCVHPDDRALQWESHQALMAGHRDHFQRETRYVHQDGQVVWGLLTASLVRDARGVPQFSVSMVEDITARKRIEEERGQLLEQVRAGAEQLRSMERWRTAFLRIMAHELRTPLGHVSGFLDLVGDESERLSAERRVYLDNARQAATRLEVLVQRAFDLMTLYSEDVELDPSVLEVGQLVETALTPYAAPARAKGIILRSDPAADHLRVWGDEHWLHRALGILLDNAISFTPAGGSVTVVTQERLDAVEIHVVDTGPGVEPEMRTYLFGTAQAEDLATRRHSGKGLGILQARRIADLHGGEIRLEASESGARFVLSLPKREVTEPHS